MMYAGDEFYDDDVTSGPVELRCIWEPCVATWKHTHGGFPGGYDNPLDPEGPPIEFEGDEPPLPDGWTRDYNGAALSPATGDSQQTCAECGREIFRPWIDGVQEPWKHWVEPLDHKAVPR